jgi:hypothetical protein
VEQGRLFRDDVSGADGEIGMFRFASASAKAAAQTGESDGPVLRRNRQKAISCC